LCDRRLIISLGYEEVPDGEADTGTGKNSDSESGEDCHTSRVYETSIRPTEGREKYERSEWERRLKFERSENLSYEELFSFN
jgi:hypothetical protein